MSVDDGTGAELWLLTAADRALVREKSRANRLAFAALLLFHRAHGRFPRRPTDIDATTAEHVAQQLGIEVLRDLWHPATDRTWKRHRAEIRTRLGYREPTVADAEALEVWLCDRVAKVRTDADHLASLLMGRCRELRIEPPAPKQENVQLSSFGRRFHPVVSASGDPADMVAGTLFEIAAAELAAAELAAADSYEVAEYRRIPARLASGADAWVYVKA